VDKYSRRDIVSIVMTAEKTPGLLLQTIPYLDNQKILKIFTPAAGIVSLFSKKIKQEMCRSPFCIAEWVYYKKEQKDMYFLRDASLSNGLLDLRTNYDALIAAGQIAQHLLHTQMPGKQAPELFVLSCCIFQKLASFANPNLLTSLFRLKFLQHEGLLSLQNTCTACSLAACHLHQGESYCLQHALYPGWTFDSEEWSVLTKISQARSFAALSQLSLQNTLSLKIFSIFEERIRH
jgi:DNA repair protein RecO (recombination protein O)